MATNEEFQLSLARIRADIARLSFEAKSAHVGSALSCVEILYAAFRGYVANEQTTDRIVLSKGHAAMAIYSVAAELGLLERSHLQNYLRDNSHLWGHPSRKQSFPFIHWSTGALGHGLPVATGFALAKKWEKKSKLTIVVSSDGECNEGSVWEAALFAAHHGLANLRLIIDYNKIQSFGRCENILKLEPFVDKWRAFGWTVAEGDGHDLKALEGFLSSKVGGQPSVFIAHTVKGKGIRSIENTLESHYKPISEAQLKEMKG